MEDILRLYRGDSRKINEFDFSKTRKHCLVGPGIYLTNKLVVAETYRVKGSTERNPKEDLFSGEAKDRPEAFEKAFKVFFDFECKYHPTMLWRTAEQSKPFLAECKANYRALIEAGKIVAEYQAVYSWQTKRPRNITVTYKRDNKVGYLTQFDFPAQAFLASMIHIDGRITDTMFWEVVHDAGQVFGRPCESREEFIRTNLQVSAADVYTKSGRGTHSAETFIKLRRVLTPFGYRGFEYNGGNYTGGVGRHRAFCVWDDEFVNQHRVQRFR